MIVTNTLRPATADELRQVQGGFLGGIVRKIGGTIAGYAKLGQKLVGVLVGRPGGWLPRF